MIGPLSVGFLLSLVSFFLPSESACRSGCDLALGSYYITPNVNLSYISALFGNTDYNVILPYNPDISNPNTILNGDRVHVNFSCDCINGDFLGHNFSYVALKGDTYLNIATQVYANLTTVDSLAYFNSFSATAIPEGVNISVIVNCSCGDAAVSKDYGLFETYPLLPGENLSTVAAAYNLSEREDLLRRYNLGSNFSFGERIFIPTKDASGSYRPFSKSAGYWPYLSSIKILVSVTEEYKSGIRISGGAIAVIIIAGLVVLILGMCLFLYLRRRKAAKNTLLLPAQQGASLSTNSMGVTFRAGNSSPFAGITVDRSVEFSYEELAAATDDFGLAHKIGGGGFGVVYYAELRGEKAAVKKMDMQASSEFLAELKVLTNVHHLNLVRLIGYCTEVSLFLVYEFIENGNLSEHLRGLGKEPLPWMTRVQIALDSARGLEYIHEHTVPLYIHRDIKSANILIDKNFHAKVADFGLAKLTDVGASLQTRLVGTFGYMPPEYAQYGEVSPKVDVYAFGVVLYELISANDAIVKTHGSTSESKGLIALFEEAFSGPDPKEELRKHVDPRLDQAYPLDSVLAMAWLAKSCTQENPQQRPTMRQIVVALMTLSSPTEVWDMSSFYDNQSLVNLMMGR